MTLSRSYIKRRTSRLSPSKEKLARSGNYGSALKRSRLRKVGNNAHSEDWRKAWRRLKPKLARMGVDCCEKCGSRYFLTPAHSLKRRHITNKTEMDEVAILCQPCHEHYELQGEAKMSKAIRAIIASRPERRLEAA